MVKLKHLRLGVGSGTPDKHAQKQMSKLGITYSHSVPQSMGDQWWFFNCESKKEVTLPEHITQLDVDPMESIGWGLSKEEAKEIRDYYGNIPDEPTTDELKSKIKELEENLHDLVMIKNLMKMDHIKTDLLNVYSFYDVEFTKVNWARLFNKEEK